jgi:hypothetical protein
MEAMFLAQLQAQHTGWRNRKSHSCESSDGARTGTISGVIADIDFG